MMESKMHQIPVEFLPSVINHLQNFMNDTEDFTKAHIRSSMSNIYIIFVFMYCTNFIIGLFGNVYILHNIGKYKMYQQDSTHVYLAGLALSDLLKTLFVLPFTFVNLIVYNWLFSETFCYMLPMTQDIPIHVSIMSHLMLALHRHRCVLHPTKPKMPTTFISAIIWLVSACIVLPYAVYVEYIDLEKYLGNQFRGSGICTVEVEHIHDYMRGMFVVLYVMPISIITFLYIKVSREIDSKELAMALTDYQLTPDSNRLDMLDLDWPDPTKSSRNGSSPTARYRESVNSRTDIRPKYSVENHNNSIDFDEDIDWTQERNTQKYLAIMVTCFALFMLPLNIIKLIKHILEENEDNKGHFDLIYVIFVWISLIPTNTTPIVYYFWHQQAI